MERFENRRIAGIQLGRSLSVYARQNNVIVLGVPRGGVPVAYEVASALELPLDVLVVRKLGVPGYEEVAMGAIASGGIQVVDRHIIQRLAVSPDELHSVVDRERCELARRERAFRRDRAPLDVSGRTAILVDDGLVTGSTMLAAVTALRARHAANIVVAVPVGAAAAIDAMRAHVDAVHCLIEPTDLEAVACAYDDFTQTTDEEVRTLLGMPTDGVHAPGEHRDTSQRRAN